MELNNIIKTLRLNNKLTQSELAKKIDVSTVSIQCWESGTKKPSVSAIISLAKVFDVSTDYLLGIKSTSNNEFLLSKREATLLDNYRFLDSFGQKSVDTICIIERNRVESENQKGDEKILQFNIDKSPSRYIPKYTTPSAAGYSVPLDGDEFEMILVDDNTPNEAEFAVEIQGNSMFPYISDGETVYVKRTSDLSIGDVGIFCVDGAMYCKQYYVDSNNNLTLVSANPELKDSNISVSCESGSDVKCYGKVLLGYKISLPDYLIR